ncbi:MAG: serine protease [Hormoscilla sp.]
MKLSGRIPSLLVSATAIVTMQAEAVVARRLETSAIEEIAERITVQIVSASPTRPNQFVYRGSGVIVKREGNSYYVLTNAHVVRTIEPYKLRGPGGTRSERRTYNVEIISKEPELDLAILRFTSNRSYDVAEIGVNRNISRDSYVYVMGWRNLGEEARRFFTRGSVRGHFENHLLTYTNETYGGMSGGPVLDQGGRLVGIHKGLRAENTSEREGISIATIWRYMDILGLLPAPVPASAPSSLPNCADLLWGPCEDKYEL